MNRIGIGCFVQTLRVSLLEFSFDLRWGSGGGGLLSLILLA